MKKSIVIILILLLTVMVTKAGTYSGGNGSSGNPFIIATTDDLIELAKTANSGDWDKYFRQTADIIFNEDETLVDWDGDGTATWDTEDQLGFYPIGKGSPFFTGVYDGDGHKIVNLFINRVLDSSIGLFASAVGSAEIMNLGIVNGNITGYSSVGMLIGTSSAAISNCFTNGSVSCIVYVAGGLIGLPANGGVIINSYSTASVNGGFDIGGLFGDGPFPTNYTVTNCYSTGAVNGTGGGLVPAGNGATFNNCFWDTETSGKGSSGGGEGKTTAEMKDFNTFTDAGWDFVVETSNGTDDHWDMDQDWSVNNGYPILSWQSESDNNLAFGGGLGTSGSPFQIDDLTDIMILSLSEQYWDEYFIQTADIDATATQYYDDSDDDSDGHPYNDANDLTSTGNNEGFTPIGNSPDHFTGNYDGDGYTIVNLFINRPSRDFVGFIGSFVHSSREIINLGIVNGDITGRRYVGLLVGSAGAGSISNCYSTGSVSASYSQSFVGGLVGYFPALNGTFNDCYSTASVSGDLGVGGLAGHIGPPVNQPLIIDNCYSTGAVSGNSDVGGLFGRRSSYTTITNCFWDTETSGQSTSEGGTGKTTAEMKDFNTYTDQATSGLTTAWDFVSNPNDDAANDDHWDMDQDWSVNNGYPILSWQSESDNTLAFGGGLGTSGSPFQIDDLTDIMILSLSEQYWDAHFIQTADIDATATQYYDDSDDDGDGHPYNDANDLTSTGNGEGFLPIASSTGFSFEGVYDGDGHTIVNLYINRPSDSNVGFIGALTPGDEIKNLGIVNGNITGDDNVGLLAGTGNGKISNCYSTGSVSAGGDVVGGLVGRSLIIISSNFDMTNCYSTASVTGNSAVGGLIGYIAASSFADPVAIENNYSTGAVSGNSDVGGLIGSISNVTVSNSFWDTETSGQGSSGGGEGKTTAEMKDFNTFTDQATTGLTTAWDFVSNPNDDAANDDHWDMDQDWSVNNGYPILSWQSESDNTLAFGGGLGTSGSPFQIDDLTDIMIISLSEQYWDKYFIQTADIDATATQYYDDADDDSDGHPYNDANDLTSTGNNEGFLPIGNRPDYFTGNYDGDGHTIVNLYINRPSEDKVGFIGVLTPGAEIKNLGIVNGNIVGNEYVGLLAGFGHGLISNCYSTGSVSATGNVVGGLVGRGIVNSNYAMTNCYSTASVTGNSYVGGLIGSSSALSSLVAIDNCYSTGAVSGNSSVGGLVGTKLNATVSNSFWDKETSGKTTSAGGTGKTTAEMKTKSTFTDAGWDFKIGTTGTWDRNDTKNGGYPFLSWQTFPNSITLTDGSSFTPSPTAGDNNQVIGRIALASDLNEEIFDGLWIKLGGSRTIGDATNFKLWESDDAAFNSGEDTQIGETVANDPGEDEMIWFTSLKSNFNTSTKYYFLTCDLIGAATGTILPTIGSAKEIMLLNGTLGIATISDVPMSSGAVPLPVELTYFEGYNTENGVVLKWETATEVNNFGFEILRSAQNDGHSEEQGDEESNWEQIGFVQGNGTTNSPKHYEFTDSELPNADEVKYRLKQIDNDGTFAYSKVLTVDLTTITSVDDEQIPIVYSLEQNYPNPFNPSTTIKFGLPERGLVDLRVYNILGEEVARLVNKELRAGYHEVSFGNSRLASGMYIYRINAGEFTQTKKLILIK